MSQGLTKKDVQETVETSLNNFSLELFKYLDKRFKKIDQKFEETDQKIDRYAESVDAYAKQAETYMQEMLALAHKVDRMEKWILQLAQATGVKLEY